MATRSFATGVTISYGPMQVTGSLVTFRQAQESLKSCCPTCANAGAAVPLFERFLCPNSPDHGPFRRFDAVKGKEINKNHVVLVGTQNEVADVTDVPDDQKKQLVVRPFKASEVESQTYPLGPGSYGTAYIFTPTTKSELFPILMHLLDSSGRVQVGNEPRILIGDINLRGQWKLMKLQTWNGHLMLHELVRPNEIVQHEPVQVPEVDQRYLDLTTSLIEADTVPFLAEDHTNEGRQKLAAFVAERVAAAGDRPTLAIEAVKLEQSNVSVSLMAALEAAVKDAKKKAPAKRTTKAPAARRTTKKEAQVA